MPGSVIVFRRKPPECAGKPPPLEYNNFVIAMTFAAWHRSHRQLSSTFLDACPFCLCPDASQGECALLHGYLRHTSTNGSAKLHLANTWTTRVPFHMYTRMSTNSWPHSSPHAAHRRFDSEQLALCKKLCCFTELFPPCSPAVVFPTCSPAVAVSERSSYVSFLSCDLETA